MDYRNKTATALMEELEATFENTEKELRTMEKYREQLNKDYTTNVELKHVLMKAREFFLDEITGAGTYLDGADVGHVLNVCYFL
jgi:hypothetical protein